MSAKARKATEDALVVAAKLQAAGHNREAEIIRRVCRSNSGYVTTLGQLWRDNMELRGLKPTPAEKLVGEIDDRVHKARRDLAADVARRKAEQSLPREDQRALRRMAKTRVAV